MEPECKETKNAQIEVEIEEKSANVEENQCNVECNRCNELIIENNKLNTSLNDRKLEYIQLDDESRLKIKQLEEKISNLEQQLETVSFSNKTQFLYSK